MRDGLIAKMTNAHQRGGDVAGWLPLLSQTHGFDLDFDLPNASVCGIL